MDLLPRAFDEHRAGRPAEAARLYRAMLVDDPRHGDAIHLLGVALRQLADPVRALTWLRRARCLAPDLPGVSENLANALADAGREAAAHYTAGRHLQALDLYDAMTAAFPDRPELRHNRTAVLFRVLEGAVAAYRDGSLERTAALCERVLASDPAQPQAAHLMGCFHAHRGESLAAVRAFLRALRAEPGTERRNTVTDAAATALAGCAADTRRLTSVQAEPVMRTLFPGAPEGAAGWPDPALLTIAIPTYNRREALDRCLSAWIREITRRGRDDVRILVSDNGSTDGTADRLRALQRDWPFLVLHRSPVNLGYEWNVVKLAWLLTTDCPTTYGWFFGDDDVCIDGALDRGLDGLQRSGADFLTASSTLFRAAADDGWPVAAGVASGGMFALCDRFGLIGVAGALSRCVFRAAPLRDLRLDRHLNSFAHSTILLDGLFDGRAAILDADLWTATRGDDTVARWNAEDVYGRFVLVADAVSHILATRGEGRTLDARFWGGTHLGFVGDVIAVLEGIPADQRERLRPAIERHYLPRLRTMVALVRPSAARAALEDALAQAWPATVRSRSDP